MTAGPVVKTASAEKWQSLTSMTPLHMLGFSRLFNASFNNISVISTENHWPNVSH